MLNKQFREEKKTVVDWVIFEFKSQSSLDEFKSIKQSIYGVDIAKLQF